MDGLSFCVNTTSEWVPVNYFFPTMLLGKKQVMITNLITLGLATQKTSQGFRKARVVLTEMISF